MSGLTCRIASLCISPVHAGIIPFNTANSSFILDLRRRSMRLCAVFLAIFLPAALVADGCFFFPTPLPVAAACAGACAEAGSAAAFPPPLPDAFLGVALAGASSSFLGFIWMIFLDLVGGGGSSKPRASLLLLPAVVVVAAEDRRRALTASLGCTGKSGFVREPERCLGSVGGEARAGGGSSNDIWRGGRSLVPSLPVMSVEEAGVGGRFGCGIWSRVDAGAWWSGRVML